MKSTTIGTHKNQVVRVTRYIYEIIYNDSFFGEKSQDIYIYIAKGNSRKGNSLVWLLRFF